jgi:hypothetical protein
MAQRSIILLLAVVILSVLFMSSCAVNKTSATSTTPTKQNASLTTGAYVQPGSDIVNVSSQDNSLSAKSSVNNTANAPECCHCSCPVYAGYVEDVI